MSKYKTFTTITDMGPYVTKLVLEMPVEVRKSDINEKSFNVYVERKNIGSDEVILSMAYFAFNAPRIPSRGYVDIKAAYPSDANGNKANKGNYVTLEVDGRPMVCKRTEGSMLESWYIFNDFRVTLLHEIDAEPVVCGLVFNEWDGDLCPQMIGWNNSIAKNGDAPLKYGYFTPEKVEAKIPLVIWLHGAGEGGQDPTISYTGNKVVHLSSRDIQGKLGGAAYILVPTCPTVWMDDGVEKLGHSNESIYVKDLKALIDEFIEERKDTIDTDRIYIGGCSNGGFMTMRMLIDYPGFFAAAYPNCEAFFDDNISDDMIASMKDTPIWFIHSKPDELVSPWTTAVPTYHRLMKAGASNVHFTFLDYMEDKSGFMKDENGRAARIFNHGVWIDCYNDDITTDFDGRRVMYKGNPVTLWEWIGLQHK